MSTEIPAYRITRKEGDIEIRDYPALVTAEVSVDGDRDAAVREGFRLLAGYIFGGNDGGRQIAMTAPVMQQAQSGTRIAMTAPVLQTKVGQSWTVGFVMPASWTIDTLPKPNNAKVQLRGVAPTRFAALRFSGLAREPDIAQHTARLNTFISMHDLKAAARRRWPGTIRRGRCGSCDGTRSWWRSRPKRRETCAGGRLD